MINEFKKFILRGNVMDLAVGIIIGAAFTAIVNSLVNDVVMPVIGLVVGGIDFSNIMIVLKAGVVNGVDTWGPFATPDAAAEAGAVTLNIGLFINAVINFLIVALAVFLMVKSVNSLMERTRRGEDKPVDPTTKDCPFCYSVIPIKATRCPECTSEVTA